MFFLVSLVEYEIAQRVKLLPVIGLTQLSHGVVRVANEQRAPGARLWANLNQTTYDHH
ncbi:hypothetical protein FIU96_06445 [Marinobacter sp. THAF39]|jgi:hypothetical protein|nr:hypothetical protein FIV08_06520 [Marinobacter sp. THAF197a]QFT50266.1 hypothetical protein FIU96_06445 [Marinobacter sp. THAF39]